MKLGIISLDALLLSLLIGVRTTMNQKSFNVKYHGAVDVVEETVSTPSSSGAVAPRIPDTDTSSSSDWTLFGADDLEPAPIVQSGQCSQSEIHNKIQCFQDLPQARYEVLLGDRVEIKCVVLNQHGKVQWRAQNLVLGYDRAVPGLERLEIVGDAGRGEHNLLIRQVRLSDEGEYECQVQPVQNHPLLRRRTNLTVLVPPSRPEISHSGSNRDEVRVSENSLIIAPRSTPSRSQQQIKQQHQQQRRFPEWVSLRCRCAGSGSPPPPQFVWSLNRVEQRPSLARGGPVLPSPHSGAGVESTLRLESRRLSSGDVIRCSAVNKATRLLHLRHRIYANNSAEVTVVFYKHPGSPVISNKTYLKSHVFSEHKQLSARCIISPRGHPAPEMRWFWRLDITLLRQQQKQRRNHHDTTSSADTAGSGSGESRHRLVYIKSSSPMESVLGNQITSRVTDLRVSKYHHAAQLVCVCHHPLLPSPDGLEDSVTISVEFPPSKLSIQLVNETVAANLDQPQRQQQQGGSTVLAGIPEISSATMLEGVNYPFVCATDLHNSHPTLHWSAAAAPSTDAINIDPTAESELGQHQFEHSAQQHFRQTLSLVTVTGHRRLRHSALHCTALLQGRSLLLGRLALDVYYAPEIPDLSTDVKTVYEHETFNFLCSSQGGNPLPDLYWYRDNQTLSNAEPTVSNGDSISSLLSFKATREDNGKLINCAARNIATSTRGVFSSGVSLRVTFVAHRVRISSTVRNSHGGNSGGATELSEGQYLRLSCETDSSNPASTVDWWIVRCDPPNSSGQGPRQAPCINVRLKEFDVNRHSGENGGWRTLSRLRYRVGWHDDRSFVECQSRLPLPRPNSLAAVQHDRIRIRVRHRPHLQDSRIEKEGRRGIGELQNGSRIDFPENSTATIVVPVKANPDPVQYIWSSARFSDLIGQIGVEVNDSVMSITNISRDFMGIYTVVVTNDVGSTMIQFFLNITYPAKLVNSKTVSIEVIPGETVSASCQFEANPNSEARIRWETMTPIDVLADHNNPDIGWQIQHTFSCGQTHNELGKAEGKILIVPQSIPLNPSKVQVFQTSIRFIVVSWVQNFNGGHKQTFRVRILPKDETKKSFQEEVEQQSNQDTIFHNISNINSGTCYSLLVGSFNRLSTSVGYAPPVEACTLPEATDPNQSSISAEGGGSGSNNTNGLSNEPGSSDRGGSGSQPRDPAKKSTSFIVTVAGCVFGFVIAVINLLLFLVCYKKRQEQRAGGANVRRHLQHHERQLSGNKDTVAMSLMSAGSGSDMMLQHHQQQQYQQHRRQQTNYDNDAKLAAVAAIEGNNHCYSVSFSGIMTEAYSSSIDRDGKMDEEIPMLLLPKMVCPLHPLMSSQSPSSSVDQCGDHFSNPLIIQDHFFQHPASSSSTGTEYNCVSVGQAGLNCSPLLSESGCWGRNMGLLTDSTSAPDVPYPQSLYSHTPQSPCLGGPISSIYLPPSPHPGLSIPFPLLESSPFGPGDLLGTCSMPECSQSPASDQPPLPVHVDPTRHPDH